QLTDTPLDNASFPWLTAQTIEAGLAVEVYALRVNFVGALGWELHFPIEYAHHLFDALFAAGKAHGIGMVGMRAMESLRLEKSYRMWGSDMTPDYTPFEASLDRFVRMNKGYFIGREALEKQLAAGVPNRFVTLEVHGVTDADPLGNEPLFEPGGRMIGRATSGYYGHCLRKSLAIGYAGAEYAQPGTQLTTEILGERKQATVVREPPYDPDNLDLRTRRRSIAPPRHHERLVVEPQPAVLAQHALRGLEIGSARDDRVQPLILDLIGVDGGVPRGKERRGADAIADLRRQ